MKAGTITHTCIEKGIIPLWVNSNGNPQQTQRNIKTDSTDYLPHQYTKTLYVDGNVSLTASISRRDIIGCVKGK